MLCPVAPVCVYVCGGELSSCVAVSVVIICSFVGLKRATVPRPQPLMCWLWVVWCCLGAGRCRRMLAICLVCGIPNSRVCV